MRVLNAPASTSMPTSLAVCAAAAPVPSMPMWLPKMSAEPRTKIAVSKLTITTYWICVTRVLSLITNPSNPLVPVPLTVMSGASSNPSWVSALMLTESLITGSADPSVIVCAPVPIENVIVSWSELLFDSSIAARSVQPPPTLAHVPSSVWSGSSVASVTSNVCGTACATGAASAVRANDSRAARRSIVSRPYPRPPARAIRNLSVPRRAMELAGLEPATSWVRSRTRCGI